MKPVVMFTLESCPYCKEALLLMEELKLENPEYLKIQISIIDERREPAISNSYDYYYVPTYYVDGKKAHEGVASKEIIKKVFNTACL